MIKQSQVEIRLSHLRKGTLLVYKITMYSFKCNQFKKIKKISVRLFIGSAWSFGFVIPATTANDLRLRRISIPDIIHYIIFLS